MKESDITGKFRRNDKTQQHFDYTEVIQNGKGISRVASPTASFKLGKVSYRLPGGNVDVLIDRNTAKCYVAQVGAVFNTPPTQPLGEWLLPTIFTQIQTCNLD